MSQDCNQVIHLHYCRGVTGAKQNGAGELLEPTICAMRSIVFRPVEGAVGFFDFLIFFFTHQKTPAPAPSPRRTSWAVEMVLDPCAGDKDRYEKKKCVLRMYMWWRVSDDPLHKAQASKLGRTYCAYVGNGAKKKVCE